MPKVKWISIEIGHVASKMQSDYAHSRATLTAEQKAVMAAVRCAARAAWAAGGEIDVPDPSTDVWVAGVLEQAINDLRMPYVDPVKINNDTDLVVGNTKRGFAQHDVQSVEAAWTSGDPGTHCRLRGDRWVNERTYRLYRADGKPWLQDSNLEHPLPADHIATATLVWECRDLGPCDVAGSALPKP